MTAPAKPALRLVTGLPARPLPNLLPTPYVEAKNKLAACERLDERASYGLEDSLSGSATGRAVTGEGEAREGRKTGKN
jgi:hypothetical protein